MVNSHFISVNCFLHNKCFSFAGVCEANTYSVRRFLWRDLSFFTSPWCILGDFNVVVSADDCKGRVAPNQVSCNEILYGINNNSLISIPFSGPCYTWSNGRSLHRMDRKLDRALCNEEYLDELASYTYQVLVKNCFDYSHILVILSSNYFHKVITF